MSFMAVMDFTSSQHTDASNYLILRVLKDVEVNPDMNITATKLNKNGNFSLNHFFNNGYAGITFKIQILIKESDMWNNKKVLDVLNDWYINMVPLSVVTDAVDVPDGQYIIRKNDSRKQTYKGSTIWELEFMTYTPLVLHKFKNTNKNVLNALKKNKARKKKKNALAKCNYKTLKYSKKKKVVKCVKTLQKILKKKKYYTGKVDGWFGKETTKAVRKFQKAYNLKHVKFVTKKGFTGIMGHQGAKLITKAKNNKNIKLPLTRTKLTTKTSKNKSTIVKMITKQLPINGKVDKATYNALIYL